MKLSNPIRLVSGALFDPFDPDVSVLSLIDISYGLSHSNRYAGQTEAPYSTAEHACHVWEAVKREGGNLATQWKALHHDDSDAFLWDIPRPLKAHPGLAWLVERERFLQKQLESLFRCNDFGLVDEDLLHYCDVNDPPQRWPYTSYTAREIWEGHVKKLALLLGFTELREGGLDKSLRSTV